MLNGGRECWSVVGNATHKAFDGGYYTFPNHEVDVYTLGGDLVLFGFCTPSFSTLSACKQNKQQTSPS